MTMMQNFVYLPRGVLLFGNWGMCDISPIKERSTDSEITVLVKAIGAVMGFPKVKHRLQQ
jgi:hypothetical protein